VNWAGLRCRYVIDGDARGDMYGHAHGRRGGGGRRRGKRGRGHGERDEPRGEAIAHADSMGRCGSA
jgi:hypothetical protein